MKTHYSTLQIVEDASHEVVKGSYRFLSQKWHPDKNPGNSVEAGKVFREINEAYAILSDPARRAEYDDWLRSKREHHANATRREDGKQDRDSPAEPRNEPSRQPRDNAAPPPPPSPPPSETGTSGKARNAKDIVGFWLQGICALILAKLVGFFGALVAFVSYFLLKPKFGVLSALVVSVVLGGAVGYGTLALIHQGDSSANLRTTPVPAQQFPRKIASVPAEDRLVQQAPEESVSDPSRSGFREISQYTLTNETLDDGRNPVRIYYGTGAGVVRVELPSLDVCVVTQESVNDNRILREGESAKIVEGSDDWNLATDIWAVAFERYMLTGTPAPCREPTAIDQNVGTWIGSFAGEGRRIMTVEKSGSNYLVSIEVRTPACVGRIGGVASISDNALRLVKVEDDNTCEITGILSGGTAKLSENSCSYYHGVVCGFSGTYSRQLASSAVPKFDDYPSKPLYAGPPAPLADKADHYRTRHTAALSENEVVFASEYVIATIGCGTSCTLQSFLNKRTGERLEDSFGGEGGEKIKAVRANSRLVVTAGRNDDDESDLGYYAYFYVLENGRLKRIAKVATTLPECEGHSFCYIESPY